MMLADFYYIIQFAIDNVVNVFTISDTIVIIDEPRFTIFSFFISILFLTLIMSFINWLRGAPGVIFNRRQDQSDAMDSRISENLGIVNQQMTDFRNEENHRFLNEYTNMSGKTREIYRRK